MFLIVGLGNPGEKYEHTRHNAGFDVLSILSEMHACPIRKSQCKALTGEFFVGTEKVMLALPQTFMNSSGESVLALVDYYQIPLDHVLVVYDDVDLAVGRIRIRQKGSAGTHNGMRSIVSLLNDEGFPRIRIGMSKPQRGETDLISYVLGRYAPEEKEKVFAAMQDAADACDLFVTEGIQAAMAKYNGKVIPETTEEG